MILNWKDRKRKMTTGQCYPTTNGLNFHIRSSWFTPNSSVKEKKDWIKHVVTLETSAISVWLHVNMAAVESVLLEKTDYSVLQTLLLYLKRVLKGCLIRNRPKTKNKRLHTLSSLHSSISSPFIASGPRHFISRGHRPWSWTIASFVCLLCESNKDLKVSRPGLLRRHGRTGVSIRAQSCDANDFHVVPLLRGSPLRGATAWVMSGNWSKVKDD